MTKTVTHFATCFYVSELATFLDGLGDKREIMLTDAPVRAILVEETLSDGSIVENLELEMAP